MAKSDGDFFVIDGSNVYRSTDNGTNWEPTGQLEGTPHSLYCHNGFLFTGTTAGVFRSADQGATWVLMNGTMNAGSGVFVHRFKAFGTELFALFEGEGRVYKTPDNGENWLACSVGLVSVYNVEDITRIGSNYYLIDAAQVYLSINGGLTWDQQNSAGDPQVGRSIIAAGSRLLISDWYAPNWASYSDDGGNTWIDASGAPDFGHHGDDMVAFGGYIYGSFGSHIARTTTGEVWSVFETGIALGDQVKHLFSADGELFAVQSDGIFQLTGTIGLEEDQADMPGFYYDAAASALRSYGVHGTLDLVVYDATGRCVVKERTPWSGGSVALSLVSGAYVARMVEGTKEQFLRFIVH